MKTYTTVQGDMWDSVAFRQLGSVNHTDKLIRQNQKYVSYHTFPAGVILTLPDIDEEISDALPPWKKVVG